jgi:hypothetical protein
MLPTVYSADDCFDAVKYQTWGNGASSPSEK